MLHGGEASGAFRAPQASATAAEGRVFVAEDENAHEEKDENGRMKDEINAETGGAEGLATGTEKTIPFSACLPSRRRVGLARLTRRRPARAGSPNGWTIRRILDAARRLGAVAPRWFNEGWACGAAIESQFGDG